MPGKTGMGFYCIENSKRSWTKGVRENSAQGGRVFFTARKETGMKMRVKGKAKISKKRLTRPRKQAIIEATNE